MNGSSEKVRSLFKKYREENRYHGYSEKTEEDTSHEENSNSVSTGIGTHGRLCGLRE